ncbi:MAG: ThuA domain-containing protein, partial [Fibrobacteria bacterium]|nr:ThuA domain-containing protein [Fibrobacteria bacterium]
TPIGSIQGQVLSKYVKPGKTIIQVLGTDKYVLSDSTGAYIISGLAQSTYQLRAFSLNTRRDTSVLSDVQVTSGKASTEINLQLNKIGILIVNGIHNHDWVTMEKYLKTILNESDIFLVDVSTSPTKDAPAEDWNNWNPRFSEYYAILLNVNNGTEDLEVPSSWPAQIRNNLLSYVEEGGGLFLMHGFSNSFIDWDPFMNMAGLAARLPGSYPGIYLNDQKEVVQIPLDSGSNPETLPADNFSIFVPSNQHPIMQNVPSVWLHPQDQLDFYLRGPQQNMTVLSYTKNPVTQVREPVSWVVNFGKGRVYANVMGYLKAGAPNTAMRCAGFQTMIIRGLEWAASNGVTYTLPNTFPTALETSLLDNLPVQ